MVSHAQNVDSKYISWMIYIAVVSPIMESNQPTGMLSDCWLPGGIYLSLTEDLELFLLNPG